MKKNILLLSVRSDQGGGPRHMLELARFLKLEGHTVLTASPLAPPYGKLFAEEFQGHFTLPHRRFAPLAWLRLALWARMKGVQIVHSHGKGGGVYGRLLGTWGFTVLHTFHGLHLKSKLASTIEVLLSLLSKTVICVSESEAKKARRLGIARQKIVVCPNGMNFGPFSASSAPEGILGTLSRLDPHKGNLRLIQLMTTLPESYSLKIAGDGEEREVLEKEITRLQLAKRVTLLGEVPDPAAFLRTISVYVSASEGEGLPYAILEAIAAEKPIVASKVPGHTDLLGEECLFDEDFSLKVSQAPAQDVRRRKQEKLAAYDLTACLRRISALY